MQLAKLKIVLAHLCFIVFLIGLPISKGVSSVAIVGMLFTALLNIQQINWRKYLIFFLPTTVFVALLISCLYSENLSKAWDHLYRQNPMLILPVIVLAHRDLLQKHLVTYFFTFIWANVFASVVTLFFAALSPEQVVAITENLSFLKDYVRHEKENAFGAYSPFIDRLHFGYLIGTALLLQLWLLAQRNRLIPLIFQLIAGVVLLLTLLISGARGAQLGLLLGLLIWGIHFAARIIYPILEKQFGKWAAITSLVLGSIGLGVVAPMLAYKTIPSVTTRYDQLRWELTTFQDGTFRQYDYVHFTTLRRLLSWQHSWDLVAANYALGVGVGDYGAGLRQRYEADTLGFPPNSHNQFFYYWAAAGLLGNLAFLSTQLFLMYAALKVNGNLRTLLLSFALFFIVVFLFDAPLLYQIGSMSYWFFYLVLMRLFWNAIVNKKGSQHKL